MALTQVKTDGIANAAVTTQQLAPGAGGGPKISSVDYPGNASAVLPTGGETVTLVGTGFDANVQVYLNTTVAPSVSFANANSVSFTTPALSVGQYILYAINGDGGSCLIPNFEVSGSPTWVTGSSLSGASGSALSIQLNATGDGPITYALAAGSSLPSGLTLSSSGLLSGTVTVGSQTVYNFTINAIDAELQDSPRAFSLTINTVDGLTAATAAPSAKYLKTNFPAYTSGVYWIKPTGYSGAAVQTYCDMTYDGGGWTMVFAYYKGQSPVSNVSSYFVSPQAAATSAGVSISAVATPNDPARSFCMPLDFWTAFSFENSGGGEFREEIAINGGTWPNNTNRVIMFIGGRTSGGATGNYISTNLMTTIRGLYGATLQASTDGSYTGGICRGGYQSNSLGQASPYSGTRSDTVLGNMVDTTNLNAGRTNGDGTNTYTSQQAAGNSSWMGRGNGYSGQGTSINGGSPDGTRWGLGWVR